METPKILIKAFPLKKKNKNQTKTKAQNEKPKLFYLPHLWGVIYCSSSYCSTGAEAVLTLHLLAVWE